MIDLVVLEVIQGVTAAILVPLAGILGIVPSYLISPLYFILFTGLKGQIPGKMATGVKIVNARGDNPGIWRALIRETIGKLVSRVFFLLGYLWVGWESRKRAWHDHIAGTFPIRTPSRSPQDSEHPDSTNQRF